MTSQRGPNLVPAPAGGACGVGAGCSRCSCSRRPWAGSASSISARWRSCCSARSGTSTRRLRPSGTSSACRTSSCCVSGGLPHGRVPDARRRRRGDHRRHRDRVPDRVLHGPDRGAAGACHPVRPRAAAAVGELPRQGLRLAGDPPAGRVARVVPRPVRPGRGQPGLFGLVDGHRVLLPLAAVHDPADLRRPRADPGVPAGGVGGPRRAGLADVPAGGAAAGVAGGGGRLDLHVLADARRLHHAAAGLEHASSSATSSTTTRASPTTSRSRPRTPSCRSRSWVSTCLERAELGAFDAL